MPRCVLIRRMLKAKTSSCCGISCSKGRRLQSLWLSGHKVAMRGHIQPVILQVLMLTVVFSVLLRRGSSSMLQLLSALSQHHSPSNTLMQSHLRNTQRLLISSV